MVCGPLQGPILIALLSPRHAVFDPRAVGLIQVKAVGLAVVFDHYLPLPFIG